MNKHIKPVIKWAGSKRSQSLKIFSLFPSNYNRYFEPFLGGGSILYIANPKNSICSDIVYPLIDFWNLLKNKPNLLIDKYEKNWQKLQDNGYKYYYEVRDRFNKNNDPNDLLFLSRTCVNGMIRFNKKGEFNNSLHHTRPGINPNTLKKIILDWSIKIHNVTFLRQDYTCILDQVDSKDFVYLDPPYFHTKGRYFGKIDYNVFFDFLYSLNNNNVKYILSFDGKRGSKVYDVDIPKDLFKRHIQINSGKSSSQKVLNSKNEDVFESIYLNY